MTIGKKETSAEFQRQIGPKEEVTKRPQRSEYSKVRAV